MKALRTSGPTLEDVRRWDQEDPLGRLRDRFDLPDGVIYLDGNSLGAAPKAARGRLDAVVADEWAQGLVRSWNAHDWIGAPARIGAKIAPLIGARADEVIVADSTSANLFKLIVAALRRDPKRNVVVSELGNFPTDLHIAEGAVGCVPGAKLRAVPRDALATALGDDVALLLLTHVHYKTAERFDMAAWTRAAHDAGALVLWDLSHSTGAVAVDLNGCDADLAVGCGYKFLNGGPGAPAFLHVHMRWQEALANPLSGWMGHAAPFAFEDRYAPAPDMARWLAGTPPILGLAALEAAVDLWTDVDMAQVAAKSSALFEQLHAIGARLGLECVSPN